MTVHRAADRFVTEQLGITTWHAFSAGPHYDPANLSFGPVIGCDEHLLEPGAGFDRHAHRGVVIVSWVLDGTLRHQDDGGAELFVSAGALLVQCCGDGTRHSETNASGTEALHFVQTTLLLDLVQDVQCPSLPVRIGDVDIDVIRGPARVGPGHAVVGTVGASVDGVGLEPGDTVRLARPHDFVGECLAISFRS